MSKEDDRPGMKVNKLPPCGPRHSTSSSIIQQILNDAAEAVCSLECPSVKKAGEDWVHSDLCKRFDEVRRQIEELEAQRSEWKRVQDRVDNREFWIWQGDGEDHLESLVCPILISPKQLLSIIASAKEKPSE